MFYKYIDSLCCNLLQQNEELKRQLTAQNKLIEKHKENIDKCLELTKKLLVEKVKNVFEKIYFLFNDKWYLESEKQFEFCNTTQ